MTSPPPITLLDICQCAESSSLNVQAATTPAGYYLAIPHRISDVLIFVYGVRFRISTISGEQIRRIVSERQSVQFQREYRHSRRRFHIEVDSLAKLDPGSLHFVVELEPHPETLLHAKEAGQPEVLFRRAATAARLHLGKMGPRMPVAAAISFWVEGHSSGVSRRVSAKALDRGMVFMAIQW